MTDNALASVGVVVIGRNEGTRLQRCLESVVSAIPRVFYVDSGSTDGSVAMARGQGVEVIELDISTPFCAARARNAGYQRLLEADPELRFVQFVDGDCEIAGDWLRVAAETLERRPELAIVVGWTRERAPDASIYNRLGDVEWNFSGAGEVDSVGGIFMIRREAFSSVGGFDPTIAAGEEPELCQRLRGEGWRFLRLGQAMATHDLAMTRFSQWWRRMVRFGYGSTDVAVRFRLPRFRRDGMRSLFWSIWLVGALVWSSLGIAGAFHEIAAWTAMTFYWGLWPAQVGRIALRGWRDGRPLGFSVAYAFFLMLSYWPQMLGQLLYWNDRLHKRAFRLIEHKTVLGSGNERNG